MAQIEYVLTPRNDWNAASHVVSWTAMAASDTGAPLEMPVSNDRSVQVTGTFGGASLLFEGSNDGVNYATLTDPQGNLLSFNSPKIEQVMELTLFVRPHVSGGDGTTSITVTTLLRRRGQ